MRTILATSAQSAVPGMGIERCGDCGLLHLHIGAVTLRLTAAALGELHAVIEHALDSRQSGPHAFAPDATSH